MIQTILLMIGASLILGVWLAATVLLVTTLIQMIKE